MTKLLTEFFCRLGVLSGTVLWILLEQMCISSAHFFSKKRWVTNHTLVDWLFFRWLQPLTFQNLATSVLPFPRQMYWISSGSAIGDDLQESRKGLWKSFPLPQATLSKLPCWASLGWDMVNSHWKPPKPEVLRAPRSASFFQQVDHHRGILQPL